MVTSPSRTSTSIPWRCRTITCCRKGAAEIAVRKSSIHRNRSDISWKHTSMLPNRYGCRCQFGSPRRCHAWPRAIVFRCPFDCDGSFDDSLRTAREHRQAPAPMASARYRAHRPEYRRNRPQPFVATSLANGRGQLCENCPSRIRHLAAADNERNHADKIATGAVRRGISAF